MRGWRHLPLEPIFPLALTLSFILTPLTYQRTPKNPITRPKQIQPKLKMENKCLYPHLEYYLGMLKTINTVLKDTPHAYEVLQDIDILCFNEFMKKTAANKHYEDILTEIINNAFRDQKLGLLLHILENLQSDYFCIPKPTVSGSLDLKTTGLCIYNLKAFNTNQSIIDGLSNRIEEYLKTQHGFTQTNISKLNANTKLLLNHTST